ncbi:MAG: hypothetical protein U5N86_08255 [Planctomycetota bacterium]|nr:hypothetical protein [Planctomycetota bacterium]
MPRFEGEYSLRLELAESGGISAVREVSISVKRGNTPPRAICHSEYRVSLGQEFTLDATASYDLDGDELTCSWQVIDGLSQWDDDELRGSRVTVKAREAARLKFQLAVSDGEDVSFVTTTLHILDEAPEKLNVMPVVQTFEPGGKAIVQLDSPPSNARFHWYQVRGIPVQFDPTGVRIQAEFLFPDVYEFAVVRTDKRDYLPVRALVVVRSDGHPPELRHHCTRKDEHRPAG